MEFLHSSFDSMSVLHDITTQAAAGTRSSNLSFNVEDANEYRSTIASSDNDGDENLSFYSSATLSTSTSLTSLSSCDSSDGIPTRPSSSQGWNFDGAWCVGELNGTPEPCGHAPHDNSNDGHRDLAERGLTDSPFLIAQYVARQLRADVQEDFMHWSLDRQTLTQTPKVSTPQLNGQYADFLELNNPYVPTMKFPSTPTGLCFQAMFSPIPPPMPTVMITAPSTEQATPTICNFDLVDAVNFLTLQYSPRVRGSPEQWCGTSQRHGQTHIDKDNNGGGCYDEDDEDVVLSRVKKTLQAARHPKMGIKGNVVGFFKMRR